MEALVAVLGSGLLASLNPWAERPPGDYLRAGIPFLLPLLAYLPVLFLVGRYVMQLKIARNPSYVIIASFLF